LTDLFSGGSGVVWRELFVQVAHNVASCENRNPGSFGEGLVVAPNASINRDGGGNVRRVKFMFGANSFERGCHVGFDGGKRDAANAVAKTINE
jgi:hypothetical protein